MKKLLTFILTLLFFTNLSAQEIPNTEAEFKKYILDHFDDYDPIIGIYHKGYYLVRYMEGRKINDEEWHSEEPTLAIIRNGAVFLGYFIGSNSTPDIFTATSEPGVYMSDGKKWTFTTEGNLEQCKNLSVYEIAKESNVDVNNVVQWECKWIDCQNHMKVFPTSWDIKQAIKEAKKAEEENKQSTGTGFSISSDGYIVTSYHVIEKAKKINVKGLNGNFSNSYIAEISVIDKNNDLAIIKITDPTFKLIGEIPYTLSTSSSEIGETVFVLGYPLTATMGDEIKLTNGIISSKSGYQGDITSYQISAPVQPGNSGGPVFDKNGNVIGIINAKHLDAENVSYAVKVNYLTNLIDNLNTKPKLPNASTLAGKELPTQVKLIKEFVYIIEVN